MPSLCCFVSCGKTWSFLYNASMVHLSLHLAAPHLTHVWMHLWMHGCVSFVDDLVVAVLVPQGNKPGWALRCGPFGYTQRLAALLCFHENVYGPGAVLAPLVWGFTAVSVRVVHPKLVVTLMCVETKTCTCGAGSCKMH